MLIWFDFYITYYLFFVLGLIRLGCPSISLLVRRDLFFIGPQLLLIVILILYMYFVQCNSLLLLLGLMFLSNTDMFISIFRGTLVSSSWYCCTLFSTFQLVQVYPVFLTCVIRTRCLCQLFCSRVGKTKPGWDSLFFAQLKFLRRDYLFIR